jgi:hypothetical protein
VWLYWLLCTVDDETKKEMEDIQQSTFGGAEGTAAQIQNFDLAGFLSGKPSGDKAGAAKKKWVCVYRDE